MVTNLLGTVLVVIIIFFICLSILFIYLIGIKLYQNKQRIQIDAFKEKYRSNMFDYLYRGDNTFLEKQLDGLHEKSLKELLSDFADVVQGEEVEERISAFAEQHFQKYYQKSLFHHRWSIRMNALYEIEDFHVKAMVPFLLQEYQKRTLTHEEKMQLIKVLVKFHVEDWETLIIRPDWRLSEFMYRSLLGGMDEGQFQEMVNQYDTFPNYIQLPVIDMIGITGAREFLPFLEQQLLTASAEKKIRILKALNELGYSQILQSYAEVYEPNGSWEERLMLSKLLGKTNLKESLQILGEFINDGNFDVRNHAAKSMLDIQGGVAYLRNIYETTSDRYAKDMAEEWLQRGGYLDGQ
ncbi:HEAT repeat domain-containing protein [Sutcliffiella rhizosphaerae]|uniref:HEAT repeat domain-containing protein n=1 Tax=Sutcliffiella rhizosphaerae TaxID=2880967 RepID=A0ABM8YRM3_9BACI|nr:HEAT repeat domain-containing protein [Sutcliffiella rhizosphaerae]CAG9622510.1 hypothetical protein BACCIP111883_03301 [Sutcliffiella rhizosphaerae]